MSLVATLSDLSLVAYVRMLSLLGGFDRMQEPTPRPRPTARPGGGSGSGGGDVLDGVNAIDTYILPFYNWLRPAIPVVAAVVILGLVFENWSRGARNAVGIILECLVVVVIGLIGWYAVDIANQFFV